MHFRLLYQGPIKSNAKPVDKQRLRLHFHNQMKYLWDQIPLNSLSKSVLHVPKDEEDLGIIVSVSGHYFAPLVTSKLKLIAELDIILLRDEEPGRIISKGDIDNRLKTIFDSLRMPKEAQEIPKGMPSTDSTNPVYCLLEDDNLISSVKVDVDRFLCPKDSDDVLLLLHVSVRPTQLMYKNMDALVL